jgi:hypothetical protein
MKKGSLTLALLWLTACSDFDLVGPPRGQSPVVLVNAGVMQEEHQRYFLNVDVFPGTDPEGRARVLSDSTLLVEDVPHRPRVFDTREGGRLRYSWDDSTSGASRSTLAIRLPDVGGITGDLREVIIPLRTRIGPGAIDVGDGENVSLHVTPPHAPSSGLSVEQVNWWVMLRNQCVSPETPFLTLQGTERFPSTMALPSTWFGGAQRDSVRACLNESTSYRLENVPHHSRVLVVLRASWQIRVRGS